ncbi:MAG: hypothetical protein KJ621_16940, partial [Proteobacteria bacterium]|nr:hypothetical protein [Pseudomonadota bacterium]
MTRWIILGLVVVVLAGLGLPAGAEPILLERNDQGAWYVIDRFFAKRGDCRVVAALLVRHQAKKTDHGPVKAITRVMRVCCKAETYQLVS